MRLVGASQGVLNMGVFVVIALLGALWLILRD